MNKPTYPTDLTSRQWDLIKEIPPAPKPGGRPRTVCLRETFNAMLYLLTTGCQWKMLPRSYPHWRTVYGYFRDWQGAKLVGASFKGVRPYSYELRAGEIPPNY